ncbi:uncharacterized protein YabE (DUF348 family) [Keratinibaculum paraultunense]|uniref:Uncharacterized protein YabE (DUF348 family) n=1 Tax=Keratinibaculum paraultunense TaxID=1278232 RepID=A0A4R3KVJ4_9FIRM|nr:3D domain-containing protein [Keratinibaculum paraultunense]QQY79880.1 G5 domain-containing protein [Keratinibaculum paraultunense]TCS88766.1 uncharacterized protein YabE (DUF348 family) [Keratinibaculum paraultunense]
MEEFSNKKANHFKLLTVLAVATTLSLGAYVSSAKDITLSIDDEKREITTYANTVEDFLKSEEITLDKAAYINVPLDTKLENNMHIIIKTPKPYLLTMGDNENRFEVVSIHTKVKDILDDLGIELGKLDYTEPGLDEEVNIGEEIKIYRVREIIEEIDEVIPHESITEKSNELDAGTTKVTQKGQDGLKKIIIKKVLENNKLISEEVIDEKIVKKPIPKIIKKGTKKVAKSSQVNRGNMRYKKVLTMVATAYSNSYESTGKNPGDKYYGITASGTKARVGTIAVDPRVIPLGTRLYVESLDGSKDYGFCIAEDTGGTIKGNRIDLFFNNLKEAKKFGRKKVKVYILD